MRFTRLAGLARLAGLGLAGLLGACAGAGGLNDVSPAAGPVPSNVAQTRIVYQASVVSGTPFRVPGWLRLPKESSGRVPAVVIVHGPDGIDGRGAAHAGALNQAGIATLEIDMWAARRGPRNPTGQARSLSETLPDAYGALLYLAAHPAIDPARIGITGYAWGGGIATVTASRRMTSQFTQGRAAFAAHVPFYPLCWTLLAPGGPFSAVIQDLSGAPMLILAGAADDYDDADSCERVLSQVPARQRQAVAVKIFPGATHGWDDTRGAAASRPADPLARKGAGGAVKVAADPALADAARQLMVQAFREAFKLDPIGKLAPPAADIRPAAGAPGAR